MKKAFFLKDSGILFVYNCIPTSVKQVASPDLARRAEFNVSRFAVLCGLSVRQLERQFQKATGNTARRFLDTVRLKTAMEMLGDGHTVKETAYLLGYKHPQNFTRKFRQAFGVSPSTITKGTTCSRERELLG